MATKKDHYGRLARLGCALCNKAGIKETDTAVEIHHIRRYGQKRDNSESIPLCAWHHRLDSHTSVHGLGHKGFEKYWGFSEEDLLKEVNDLLQKKS